jgi:hypothetical protein
MATAYAAKGGRHGKQSAFFSQLGQGKDRRNECGRCFPRRQVRLDHGERPYGSGKIIADLRTRRDAFLNEMQQQAGESEATWLQAQARLEADHIPGRLKKIRRGIRADA